MSTWKMQSFTLEKRPAITGKITSQTKDPAALRDMKYVILRCSSFLQMKKLLEETAAPNQQLTLGKNETLKINNIFL